MEPSGTRNSLDTLEQTLIDADAPIVHHWQPGSEPDNLAVDYNNLPAVQLHPDLIAWYGWHDGTDLQQPIDGWGVQSLAAQNLFGSWYLLGSVDAAAVYQKQHQLSRYTGEDAFYPPRTDRYFPDGWLPILQANDAWLSLDTTARGSAPLWYIDLEEPDGPLPAFSSIRAMADTFNSSANRDLISYNPDKQRWIRNPKHPYADQISRFL